MFKHFIFSLALVVSTGLFGQITLHSSDFPSAGDSTLTSLALTSGTTAPSLTGANVYWDYSTLTPDIQRYEKFDSPFTFVSPFNLLFSVLNTTYGRDNYTLTTLPIPGITFLAAYDFFKKTSNALYQVGSGYSFDALPLPIPFYYSPKDTLYQFPVNYLNVDSCDFKFGLPIPTIGYYGQKGHRVNTVDGWGQVTTPYSTFNALRIKSTVLATDTVYVDTLGFGFNIPRPLTTEYKWLATGMDVPVLQINTTTIGASENVTYITYIDSTRFGVPQVGIVENATSSGLSVYPNPTNDQFVIQYNLNTAAKVKISITNMLGQMLAVVQNENAAAGKNILFVNTNDLNLNPGIYFVNLESDHLFEAKKIVISK